MKKLFLFLLTVFCLGSLTLSAQNTLTVANGTETNNYIPVYGYWADAMQQNQVIYPASMITQLQGQQITSMTFYPSGNPNWGSITYTIRMAVVNDSVFATGTPMTGSMDIIYSGHVDIANDQLVFAFDDGFTYTGGHLIFDLQTTPGSFVSNSFYGINTSYASSFYSYDSYGSVSTGTELFIPKTTFTYETPETCIKPNNLQINTVTNSSASFSWHPLAAGTSSVAIGIPGDDISTLTWTTVADTFYTFTGLNAGTLYNAYVKTNCGGGDESYPASKSFYTYCDAVTQFPWSEGFEDDWMPTIAFGQNHNAPFCWKVYHGANNSYLWEANTDPSNIHTGSGSAFYESYYSYNSNEWLVSPMLSLSGNQMLSFYASGYYYESYYGSSSYDDYISVWISDEDATLMAPASDTSALPGFTKIASFTTPGGWFLYEVPLTGYTGNRYIAFVRDTTATGYYLMLDDVTVDDAAACLRPTELGTDSVGTNFANLTWNSDANDFIVYYRTAGAADFQTAENVTLDADTLYTLTGLTPGNAYEWYVAAICGDDTLASNLSTPMGHFVTECAPVTPLELPLTWDFENNLHGGTEYYPLPTCWSRIDPAYPYVYESFNYYDYSYDHVLACGNGFDYTAPVYDGNPKIVVLPELDNTVNISNLQLNFWANTDYNNSAQTYPTFVEVGVMTDPNDASTFTPVDTASGITTVSNEFMVTLDGYAGNAHYVALRLHPGKYYDEYDNNYVNNALFIVNISLSLIPSCPRPEAVAVTDITSGSATLTWSSEENEFMVYYRVHGTSAYTAIADGPVSDTTYTLTNLQPNTNYDVYVASVCSDGTETPSIGTSFTTHCTALDSVPVFYDFETNNTGTSYYQLPICWTRGNQSEYYPYAYDYDYYAYQGDVCMEFIGTNTVALPAINTAETPISSLMASFYARYYSADYACVMQVGVMTDPTNPATFVQVGNDIILTGTYSLYEHSLASYQGTGTYIAFRIVDAGATYNPDAFMDNLLIAPLPDCVRPSSFSSNVGLDEATVTWNATADQTEWEVAVGSASADPDTLPFSNVFSNSITLNNLDPNTTYTIFVRTICSGEESDWSDGYSFTTLLTQPAMVPYVCDFEDTVENANWIILNGTETNQWYIDTAANNTPNGQHALYISNDNGVTNHYSGETSGCTSTVWAYRDIQFPDADEFLLSFDWKCNGESSWDYMKVYIGPQGSVSSGSTTAPAGSVQLGGYHNQNMSWQTETAILDGQYANSIRRIFFLWRNDSFGEYNPPIAVDNISITTATCARPTNVTLVANNIGSATLGITPASENDVLWEISINDSLVVVNDTLPVITVAPGTEYEVFVRTICDAGDTSVWSLPLNFISECEMISSVPQTWGFESDLIGNTYYQTPLCWNIISSYASYPYPYVYQDDYSAYAHTGTHSLYFYNYYPGYAVMPALDLQNLNIQNLQLSFFANTTDHSGLSSLQVGVMTDPTDPSTFTLVQTVNVPYEYGADPVVVNFANYTGTGAYIAIRNLDPSNSYTRYSVDDVTLETVPTCPTPTALTVSNITTTSAVVAWTEIGSATSWNLKIDDGTTDTTMQVTTNPYTLTGLTAGTTYEITIQANCGGGDVSPWRLPEYFNTAICDSIDQCVFTFNLIDGFGDGWNGAYLTVVQNNLPVATLTISSYSSNSTELVTLCDNIPVSLVWSPGNFDDEISFNIVDPNNTQIYTISDLTGYTTHTFTPNCSGTPVVTDPTVATNEASAIAQTTATLNATITNPDNVTITAKGFEWKTTNGGSYTQIAGTGTDNTYTANLTNLTPNTGYTYKAFITFNGTTVYGSEQTFTTSPADVEPCETPTNLHATEFDTHSITIGWNANGNATSWNIHYRVENGGWNNANTTTNTYVISGLVAETTYEIEVQADCGNGNLSDWSAPIHISTAIDGIESWLENSVSLYPNPAKEVINVQCTMNNVQIEAIEVYDVYGKVVRTDVETCHGTSLQTRINVSGLANGMYFVRVTTEKGAVTKPFVKK